MAVLQQHVTGRDCSCSVCSLTRRHLDGEVGDSDLANAVALFRAQPEALDGTLFDSFGAVLDCAGVSTASRQLVAEYLQLVVQHCSGREVLTMLMAVLDSAAM